MPAWSSLRARSSQETREVTESPKKHRVTGNFYPFARSQSVHDVADVGVNAAIWSTLAVRRAMYPSYANPTCNVALSITLSVSPLQFWSATSTFATNHGPTSTTVLSGTVALGMGEQFDESKMTTVGAGG